MKILAKLWHSQCGWEIQNNEYYPTLMQDTKEIYSIKWHLKLKRTASTCWGISANISSKLFAYALHSPVISDTQVQLLQIKDYQCCLKTILEPSLLVPGLNHRIRKGCQHVCAKVLIVNEVKMTRGTSSVKCSYTASSRFWLTLQDRSRMTCLPVL